MFQAHVFIIRRSKLHYTASGIITPIGVMIPITIQCTYNITLKRICETIVVAEKQ